MMLNQDIDAISSSQFTAAEQQTPAAAGETAALLRPRGRPWVKGQSGNPRGRPSRARQAAYVAEALIAGLALPASLSPVRTRE
ncbi:MAG TPA: hypothetical protein VMI30_07985 [Stellaceae bacterium]|nr:hypothetical protein [Stellaceae bacterium]